MGRLLDALAERKLADNTLLIFTSDNGAHWLPNDIQEWGHRANADWRGQKSDLWEGGHRVPLIVRYPGVVNAGTHSDQLVCLTDVLATVAEIVARPLNVDMGEDSHSFAGVLRQAPASGHGAKRSSTSRAMEPWQSARVAGSWRRSWARTASAPKNIEPVAGGPRGQLYDLVDDPAETRNLWLARPEIVERLTRLLADYQQSGRSRPAAP